MKTVKTILLVLVLYDLRDVFFTLTDIFSSSLKLSHYIETSGQFSLASTNDQTGQVITQPRNSPLTC